VKKLLLWALAASLLVAAGVTFVSLLQTPTYEASAKVRVDQEQGDQQSNLAVSGEEIKTEGLPRIRIDIPEDREQLQALTQTMIIAIDTRPVADEAIRRLDLRMSPDELLNSLTIEQLESSQLIQLSYTDTDPARATQVVNTVGQVSSERISEASATANNITATVYEKAEVPDTPASPKPLRNGLIALVVVLVLCAGLAKLALARTAGRARAAGTLGERSSRLAKLVGQAGVLGSLGRWHSDTSIVERIKEKKLLRALGRRGKLTAVEAALESSLSVEEANRMLFELAARGHLEVTVEHGKLLYSFWGEHGA
jgi:capsular polysaccharide biosynthesis protein